MFDYLWCRPSDSINVNDLWWNSFFHLMHTIYKKWILGAEVTGFLLPLILLTLSKLNLFLTILRPLPSERARNPTPNTTSRAVTCKNILPMYDLIFNIFFFQISSPLHIYKVIPQTSLSLSDCRCDCAIFQHTALFWQETQSYKRV